MLRKYIGSLVLTHWSYHSVALSHQHILIMHILNSRSAFVDFMSWLEIHNCWPGIQIMQIWQGLCIAYPEHSQGWWKCNISPSYKHAITCIHSARMAQMPAWVFLVCCHGMKIPLMSQQSCCSGLEEIPKEWQWCPNEIGIYFMVKHMAVIDICVGYILEIVHLQ